MFQGRTAPVGASWPTMSPNLDPIAEQVISRRDLLASLGGAVGSAVLAGCRTISAATPNELAQPPRLTARPKVPTASSPTGRTDVDIQGLSAAVYVPKSAKRDQALPLVMFLHGALRT